MRQKLLWIMLMCSFTSHGQKAQELSYHTAFVRSSILGRMTIPNIYEFGIGYRGGGGIHPYFGVNLGYMGFGYTDTLNNRLHYRSLTYGWTVGFRPLAKIMSSRFQPLVQMSFKSNLKLTKSKGGQSEQLFSNGQTKLYDQTKIRFFSFGAGCEYFMSDSWSASLLLNCDIIHFSYDHQYAPSLSLKLKRYVDM